MGDLTCLTCVPDYGRQREVMEQLLNALDDHEATVRSHLPRVTWGPGPVH